jgi:hypothetical protein
LKRTNFSSSLSQRTYYLSRVSERFDRDDVQRKFYEIQLDHDSDKESIAKNARDKKDLRKLKVMLLLQTTTFE